MIISIDYDDTYTRDSSLWNTFCKLAIQSGHDVWCVSARHYSQMDDVKSSVGKIIGQNKCVATNGLPKKDFMWEEKDIYIDVWIDDQPDMVTRGYEVNTDYLSNNY